jgi:hypothetical protein
MTRNTTTSTGEFARGKAVGLLAVALLLSGCAAGSVNSASTSGTPTPTPTPTVEPAELMAEIGATFPTEAEWLEDYESAVWCTAVTAGLNSCGDEASVPRTVSNGWKVRADVTDVTAAAVVLEVSDLGSAEAAEKFAQEVKASEARFDGDFDIPMNAEENKAGLRGTGTWSILNEPAGPGIG